MPARARRGKAPYVKSPLGNLGDEGAERYTWTYSEENRVVLVIPGLRDLKLSVEEARAIGEMLIQTADEMATNSRNLGEGGDSYGGSEERPVQG
jgi:hypothetical protein